MLLNMLQEIAYWTYYFCHKNHFLRQNGEEVIKKTRETSLQKTLG